MASLYGMDEMKWLHGVLDVMMMAWRMNDREANKW